MGDLISRKALLEEYDLKNCVKYGNKNNKQQTHSYSTLMMYEVADMIREAPAVDDMILAALEQKRLEVKDQLARSGHIGFADMLRGRLKQITDDMELIQNARNMAMDMEQ